jgi:hypothetical protein
MRNWVMAVVVLALIGGPAWGQESASESGTGPGQVDEAKLAVWTELLDRAEEGLADAPVEKLPTAYRWLCVAQAWQVLGDAEAAGTAAVEAAACLRARDEAKPRGGATMSQSRPYSPYRVACDTAFLLADTGDRDGALDMLGLAEKWLVSPNKQLTIAAQRANILARTGQTEALLEKVATGVNAETIVAIAEGYRAAGGRDGAIQVLNAIEAGLGPVGDDETTAAAIDAISRDIIRLERIRLGDGDNLAEAELTIKEEFYLLLAQIEWGETEAAEATLENLLTRIADLPPVEQPEDADDPKFSTQFDMISYLAYVMAGMDKTDEALALLAGSDYSPDAANSQQFYRIIAIRSLGETEAVSAWLADVVAGIDDGTHSAGDAVGMLKLQQAWGMYVGVPHETRELLAGLHPDSHQFDLAGGTYVVAMYYQQGMAAEIDALLPKGLVSHGQLLGKVMVLLADVGDVDSARQLLAEIGPGDQISSNAVAERQWSWLVAYGAAPLGMAELQDWLDELEGQVHDDAVEGAVQGIARAPKGLGSAMRVFDLDETVLPT